jgi:hypothetical protein
MYPNRRYQSPSYSRQSSSSAQRPATKTASVALFKRSQTRPAPIGIEPDYDETELTQTVLQNAHGKRYTMVSNGWSKECTITALIQFEDAAQALQMTPKEKTINIQFVLHATSQRHIYKSTITQVGINVNAAQGPTAPTPARYQQLVNALVQSIFGPNDRHLQSQYLRYGITICDLPIRYFYGRYAASVR